MNTTRIKSIGTGIACLFLLAGCHSGGSSGSGDSTEVNNSLTGTAKLSGKVDVKAFKGGYGIDFYQDAAKEFDQKNPGVTTTVAGDPRIWEQLRPLLNGGTPPDLMFPGWGMDHWLLADEGELMGLDKALDGPPAEGSGTWRDTFEPSLLKMGQKDGKQFVLPYYFNVMGWWYDPGVFAAHGWTPPKTFMDLQALCLKIKAAGMAPITFQGKYPYYMLEGILYPWVVRLGGIQAMNDAQNLVKGAWKSKAMVDGAQMIKQLNDNGFFQKGAVGMSHTESQTEFLLGHAAMIPCGTWLHSEMVKTMPPTAKMEFMLPPVPDGPGDASALLIGIEPWMVPAQAKNPEAGIAFFKYMTSLDEAKKFVTEKETLMSIKGSDQVKLPETLVEPARLFKESKTVWADELRQWYPAMETEIENALTSMLNNQITPEQFCDRAEAAAEKVRNDSSITKHKI